MRSKGVEVHTLAIDIGHWQFHPYNMADNNGMIDKNLQPFKYSDFRRHYKVVVDKFESAVK